MARVITRTSLSRSSSLLGSAFLSFFARSLSLVVLVKAIVLPSGDHAAAPAPFGRSVSARASPPRSEITQSCAGCGRPSFSSERLNASCEPSGDQRGLESCPLVNARGGSLPSAGAIQIAVS
jgi:hypothetical protein